MAELPEMDSEAMLQDNTTLPENQLQANDTDFDRSYHLFMNDALAGYDFSSFLVEVLQGSIGRRN